METDTREVADLLVAIADSETSNRDLTRVSEFLELFTGDTLVGDIQSALDLYFSL